MLRLRLVVGNIVLSLRPGDSDALTRGLNEVRRKINVGALRNTYAELIVGLLFTDRPTILSCTQYFLAIFQKK